MTDRRALVHRVLALELTNPAPAARAQVSSALHWRDACDARQLTINVLVRRADDLTGVEHLVRHVDMTSARHRDRPVLRFFCVFPESLCPLVDRLAEADTRTPRLEIIRVLDRPLAPGRLAQVIHEAGSAESAQLLFWAYLQLASTYELAQLASVLSDPALGPPHRPVFRRFPVVEVPGSFSIGDADPIAEFWSLHPQMQEASSRSLGGRVETFFRYFEVARLAKVGVEPPALSGDETPSDRKRLSAFRAWLDHNSLLTTEPRVDNGVLEHDIDLLADSHECQSPVFTFAGVSTYVDAARSSGSTS